MLSFRQHHINRSLKRRFVDVPISLCMIVKNEEDVLGRCLASVKHFVDEIIIVDTGSTDSTVEIAKKYGAKIFYYKWDNSFSNARNCALEKAEKDWILIMDADDEFEKEDTNKLLKLTKDKNSKTNVYFMQTLSYSGDSISSGDITLNLNVRLVRNKKGYKFLGDIHEQLIPPPEHIISKDDIKIENIRFYHYGYLKEIVESKDKRQRNMDIIQKELDKDPHNGFMLFNMGNEYYAKEDYKKALECYMKSYEQFNPTEGFSSKLILRIVSCNQILENFAEEYKFVDRGLKYYPNFTDLEFIRGNTFITEKKYLKAISSLKKCIKMGEPPIQINELVGVGSYRTYLVLCNIYLYLGDNDSSLYYCDKILKMKPGYVKAIYKLCEIMAVKKASINEMKSRFDSYVDKSLDPNIYLVLSDVFYGQNKFDIAYEYADRADKMCKDETDRSKIYYYKGVCLFYQKKFKDAYGFLKKISSEEFIDKAFYYTMLCNTFDDTISTKDVLTDEPKDIPDNKKYMIYMKFKDLLEGRECTDLSEDTEDSKDFCELIFNLLAILLKINCFDEFEKGLQLLNLIENQDVLLYLGKLYYKNGYPKLAYKELARSIKIYDRIDVEALEMMKKCL